MTQSSAEETPSTRTTALCIILLIAVFALVATQLGVLRFESAPADAASISMLEPPPSPAPPALADMNVAYIAADFPDTAAGRHAEWAIGQLNIDLYEINESVLQDRFVESTFVDRTPGDVFHALDGLSSGYAPYALVGFVDEPEEYRLHALLRTRWLHFQVLTVEVDETSGRLEVLWFANPAN